MNSRQLVKLTCTNLFGYLFSQQMFNCAFCFCLDSKSKPSHVQKAVKSRSSFSLEQISYLERVFEKQKYLGSRDRKKISDQLQMTETQVRFIA